MKPRSPKQLERMLNTLLAKTMHGAKNDVAKVFQEMIRLEYAAAHNGWLDCVTCDYRAHWTATNTFDAGHFVQARRSSVIFAEDPTPNCHPQCKRCNKKDDLNNRDVPAKYRDYMVSRYGKPAVEELEALGRQTKQFTKRELLELKLGFMARTEAAKERLRNPGTRLSENHVGQLLEDIECIIGHCRDQTGWRLNKIREAAERIEFIFVPPLETNGTTAASDATGKDGPQEAE